MSLKYKYLFLFLMLLSGTKVTLSQDSLATQKTIKKTFIPLKLYKQQNGEKLTKQDSLNFIIRDKDTLVVSNDYKMPKGVLVPYEERDSVFLELYKDVVFQSSKYWKKNIKKHETIKYWKDEIKLYFDKTVDKTIKKELLKFALDLSDKVDSLKIREVNTKEESNYFVYSLNKPKDYKYEERLKGLDGVDYYINWDGKQQFYKCMLELNPQILFNKERLIFDAKKDFFLSLGYFHKTVMLSCDSFLSECNSEICELSKIDLEILKYHYSYGICKGIDLKAFEEQHEKAKELLKNTGQKLMFLHED